MLLEREFELRAVDAALEAARRGDGALLSVVGAAGTGKSSLLEAAASRARAAGMGVLSGRGSELEREFPFGVVLQMVEPALAPLPRSERAELLSGAAGLAEPLLNGAVGAGDHSGGRAFPLFHGLHWLVANLSERRPLLLAVDDVHWADELSVRFLLYLAERLDGIRVATITTHRPRDPGHAELLTGIERAARERLRLAPLSERAVHDLTAASLPRGDAEVAAAVWEATRGNPFLVRQLLSAASELESPTADRLRSLAPGSVERRVAHRLERIPVAQRKVAEALATLPERSPLADVAALARVPAPEAAEAVDALAALGLVEGGASPAFAHPLVRQAVYEAVGETRRAEAHARAAVMLRERGAPTAAVAGQLLRATPGADPEVVGVLRDAAAEATARGSAASAVRYLRRALAEGPSGPGRAELLLDLGRLEAVGGDPEGVTRLEEALEAAGDDAQRARIMLELGRALALRHQRGEALAMFERGRELAPDDDPVLASELNAAYVFVAAFDIAHTAEASARVEAVVARESAPATPVERALIGTAAVQALVQAGPREMVIELGRRAFGDGALITELGPDAEAVQATHIALFLAGDVETARAVIDGAVEEARRFGSVLSYSMACQYRSQANLRLGRLSECVADAESALEAMRGDWGAILPGTRGSYALALIARGDAAAADPLLESDAAEEDVFGMAFLLEARGWRWLRTANAARAKRAFLGAGERFLQAGWVNPAVSPWRAGAAIACSLIGDRDEAERLATEELELAESFGAPAAVGVARWAAGLVRGGDAGIELLEGAVDVLSDTEYALDLSRALIDLGAALRRAGRTSGARRPLERGMGLAHRIEAVRLERIAADELRTLGARPRRASVSGPDALTPSERRVARMAADGMKNREIAQALFVTQKAVEWHLRNAYAKLGIRSRDELAAALASEERAA